MQNFYIFFLKKYHGFLKYFGVILECHVMFGCNKFYGFENHNATTHNATTPKWGLDLC